MKDPFYLKYIKGTKLQGVSRKTVEEMLNTLNNDKRGSEMTPEEKAETHATDQTLTGATHDSILRRARIKSYLAGHAEASKDYFILVESIAKKNAEIAALVKVVEFYDGVHNKGWMIGLSSIGEPAHEVLQKRKDKK